MGKKIDIINLGRQPLANRLVGEHTKTNEYFYELRLLFDEDTKEVTTTADQIDPPDMFNENYPYRAGQSMTFRAHLEAVADIIKGHAVRDSRKHTVLEIGSNDGTLIKHLSRDTTVAVEPCPNFALETTNLGYKTYSEFWTMELGRKIVEENGHMQVVFASNTFSHMTNLREAFQAIQHVLRPDGVFILEDPSLMEVLARGSYDQFYDEHPNVFSITAIRNILLECGDLDVLDVEFLPSIHGGSNRYYIGYANQPRDPKVDKYIQMEAPFLSREVLISFAKRVKAGKDALLHILNTLKFDQGKKIVSYGATSKSITVFNYCQIGPKLIDYIVDTTPEKIGTLSPGMHIPILRYDAYFDKSVDVAFLGAWNFEREILAKEEKFLKCGGMFLTHVPTVRGIWTPQY